ncbi:MFS transporter [Actinoplanes subtropicus]|uniref:MFS transporter n=1 Tax=Actinoplanes subtropicus TaxID=543632 RepID=UPI00054DA292|nr:MFS transporter [Actinoplanes subtropicus]
MPKPAQRPVRPRLVLAICCVSIVLVVMDISIVNVALPAIQRDLHATTARLQWTVDAYTLVLACFLVLAGSSADRYGRRRTFQIGLAVFALGSLLCALAPGTGWLVAARVLQGIGGTMLNPVAIAIIANTFTGAAERARAVGVFASMSGLALVLGPVLGGFLVGTLGWHAVFWVNVPIAVAVIGLAAFFVPESRGARARRFDPVGQVLVVVLLGCAVSAVIESRPQGWGSPLVLGLLAIAVVALAALVAYEPRRHDPLLELRLFRSVPFSSAIVIALCAMCGFGAFLFLTTQYLQVVRGLSALQAGLALVPLGVVVLAVAPLAGRLTGSAGPRLPLVVAGATLAGGSAVFVRLSPATPAALVVTGFVCFGVFLGAVNPPITNTAISGMPRSMSGVAGSVASVGRQTGTTLGVGLAGAIAGAPADHGGAAYLHAARTVWWLLTALGLIIVASGITSTTRLAHATGARAATLFAEVDQTPEPVAPNRARR